MSKFVMIIFGASGDLTKRKLMPALYSLYKDNRLPEGFAILGIGRATAYKLANSGLFKMIRIGNMIRISRKSFEDWLKAEGLDDEM